LIKACTFIYLFFLLSGFGGPFGMGGGRRRNQRRHGEDTVHPLR